VVSGEERLWVDPGIPYSIREIQQLLEQFSVTRFIPSSVCQAEKLNAWPYHATKSLFSMSSRDGARCAPLTHFVGAKRASMAGTASSGSARTFGRELPRQTCPFPSSFR
jgi:hypothetical protein